MQTKITKLVSSSLIAILVGVVCVLVYANDQNREELKGIKQLSYENLTNAGNILIRSHQVRINKNFQDPVWRKSIADAGGLPILRIETDFTEKISLQRNMYENSRIESSVYAQSESNLDLSDYGDKVINTIEATNYVTPETILSKATYEIGKQSKYWTIRNNESAELLYKSSMMTCASQLFGDIVSDQGSLYSDINSDADGVVTSVDPAKEEGVLSLSGYAHGLKIFTKTLMSDHPEKLISVIHYDGKGGISKYEKVSYSGLKPVGIVEYTFFGKSVDPANLDNEDFLFEQSNSVLKTTILEYVENVSNDVFDVDPLKEVKEGDRMVDHIAGTYQVVGDDKSIVDLAEMDPMIWTGFSGF